jgi:hypothetical protein
MKNGNTYIIPASPVRIYLRRILGSPHLPLQNNMRHVLRVRITDLIIGWVALMGDALPLRTNQRHAARERITDLVDIWGYCGTNRRHTLFDTCLVFDASHGHPDCQLHPGASQDLTSALYLHKQHIVGDIHAHT